jgi:hypothetical protein
VSDTPIIPDALVGFPLGYLAMNRHRPKRHRCLLHQYSRPRNKRQPLHQTVADENRHSGPGSINGAVFDWLERNEAWVIGERVRFIDPELDSRASEIAIERDAQL